MRVLVAIAVAGLASLCGAQGMQVVRAPLAKTSLGFLHTCALTSGGAVFCWGATEQGQIGFAPAPGAALAVATPQRVAGLAQVIDLSAGPYRTCGVLADGQVFCWGRSVSAVAGAPVSASEATPTLVDLPGPADQISVGGDHACAITTAARVMYWGSNDAGQLRHGGSLFDRGPVTVTGLTDVVQISASSRGTCARTAQGQVACWGGLVVGMHGPLRPTSGWSLPGFVPLPAAAAVLSGPGPSAVLTDGRGFCWDERAYSRATLADGSVSAPNLAVPEQVAAEVRVAAGTSGLARLGFGGACVLNGRGTLACTNTPQGTAPFPASGVQAQAVVSVAAGWTHACAVLATGTVQCWGSNGFGERGTGAVGDAAVVAPVVGPGGAGQFKLWADADFSPAQRLQRQQEGARVLDQLEAAFPQWLPATQRVQTQAGSIVLRTYPANTPPVSASGHAVATDLSAPEPRLYYRGPFSADAWWDMGPLLGR